MFNYYTDLIIIADKILAIMFLIMASIVIIFAVMQNSLGNMRIKGLLNIKKNLHALAVAGRNPGEETCPTA